MTNSSKKKVRYGFKVYFVLILLSALLYLVYISVRKAGFNIDEISTYGLSNSYFEPFPYRFREWVPSDYYLDYLTVNPSETFSYDSVYYNQVNDVHPPLFYYLVHVISSIFTGSYSKWLVIGINMVFYTLTFLVIYTLLNKISNNKWFALTGAVFWGLSIGAISSVLFLRMYVMLTFLFIFLLYMSIALLDQLTYRKRLTYLGLLFLTIVAGSLTHYYFLIYSFFVILVLSLMFLYKKQFKLMISTGSIAILAILSFFLLFPGVVDHVQNTGRGNEAVENLTGGASNLIPFLKIINHDLFAGLFVGVIIILAFLVILKVIYSKIKYKSQINILRTTPYKVLLLLIVPSFLYVLLIQQIAPYQTSRYVYAIYPSLVAAFFVIIDFFTSFLVKTRKSNNVISLALLVLFSLPGLITQDYDYLTTEYSQTASTVDDYSHLNVLVITSARWRIIGYLNEFVNYSNVYPHLIQNQDIYLPEDSVLEESDELIVYIDSNFKEDMATINQLMLQEYGYTTHHLLYGQSYSTVYLYQK